MAQSASFASALRTIALYAFAGLALDALHYVPQRHQATVDERGIRFFGRQRQQLGIARALCHNPQMLILDKATSALDNLTEQAVMEAVHNLGHGIAIILVAHRLSTAKEYDTIFLLEKGELKAQGSFGELTQASERCKAMAGAN